MTKTLINTADATARIAKKDIVSATARSMKGVLVSGFLLHLEAKGGEELVLSTYLSDKPRLFKRADALLSEATNLGLTAVCFELTNKR